MNDIEELLREREGYVRRGLVNRVAQVDALLDALGHKPERAERRQVETAEGTGARRRGKGDR